MFQNYLLQQLHNFFLIGQHTAATLGYWRTGYAMSSCRKCPLYIETSYSLLPWTHVQCRYSDHRQTWLTCLVRGGALHRVHAGHGGAAVHPDQAPAQAVRGAGLRHRRQDRAAHQAGPRVYYTVLYCTVLYCTVLQVPECRNVTKQNCVTLWERDEDGNQVGG